jgi:hypothetical protein
MRRSLILCVFLACGGAPLPILISGTAAHAQVSAGTGLATAVDVERKILVLETRTGSRSVLVAPNATVRDDHGRALELDDIRPGDAVAYQVFAGRATSLDVARQFWAIPSEPVGAR